MLKERNQKEASKPKGMGTGEEQKEAGGVGPRKGMKHQLFENMREGTPRPRVGWSAPICLPLDSLTLGAPILWLHMSLELGPELCACLRFPFTNSCSFLSFFCLPAGSKIFCTLLRPDPTS